MFSIVKKPEFIVNMLLHSILLFNILSILFIKYISKITTHTFNEEISHTITTSMGEKFNTIMNNNIVHGLVKDKTKTQIYNLFAKPYKETEIRNKGLFDMVIVSNIMLWVTVIIIILIFKFSCNAEINMTHIITDNIAVFTIIGIFEYIFFKKIALKYIPVLPSFISNEAISTLKAKVNQ